MSFVQKFKTSQGQFVYLVYGKNQGADAWHYVLVSKAKLPLFLARKGQDPIDVADYGLVLYSGWGKEPPPEVVELITLEYKNQ